ncbi:MAG: hypothetical protein ABIR36_07860 [Nitrospiraceae bacterium]
MPALFLLNKANIIIDAILGNERVLLETLPWYVVPADDKENARLIVSQIILDTLDGLKMAYPKTTTKGQRALQSIRKQLAK